MAVAFQLRHITSPPSSRHERSRSRRSPPNVTIEGKFYGAILTFRAKVARPSVAVVKNRHDLRRIDLDRRSRHSRRASELIEVTLR